MSPFRTPHAHPTAMTRRHPLAAALLLVALGLLSVLAAVTAAAQPSPRDALDTVRALDDGLYLAEATDDGPSRGLAAEVAQREARLVVADSLDAALADLEAWAVATADSLGAARSTVAAQAETIGDLQAQLDAAVTPDELEAAVNAARVEGRALGREEGRAAERARVTTRIRVLLDRLVGEGDGPSGSPD